jgi:hypothetical protein
MTHESSEYRRAIRFMAQTHDRLTDRENINRYTLVAEIFALDAPDVGHDVEVAIQEMAVPF